jgi:molecular chaperone GrpE
MPKQAGADMKNNGDKEEAAIPMGATENGEKRHDENMHEQKEELRQETENWKNKYLRALADYRNLETRTAEDKDRIRRAAVRHLILKLLPFLDGLDKAETFVKDPGLRMVRDNLWKSLQGEGLEELPVLGREYDPYNAEVIELVKGEKDNVVVEVIRKGYALNGETIRVAQVKVSKKT